MSEIEDTTISCTNSDDTQHGRSHMFEILDTVGQQAVIMEAIKAGAKDFVVKPFDADRIQSALWKLVG